jgi:transposase
MESNELAAFGYNRDKKHGKKQVVIGLLTADDGEPLAVRVFAGNTADPSTIYEQINLMKSQFGIEEVVLVGDRGMIKAKGKDDCMDAGGRATQDAKAEAIDREGWKYLTALTNAQTRTLLKQGVLQTELFDHDIAEVEHGAKRLILRCNPARKHREQQRRLDKLTTLQHKIEQRNLAVKASTRAQPEKGLEPLRTWCQRHKLSAFVTLTLEDRLIRYELDAAAQRAQGWAKVG